MTNTNERAIITADRQGIPVDLDYEDAEDIINPPLRKQDEELMNIKIQQTQVIQNI